MFNNFISENRAAYAITSKNMVEPQRPQMTSQYGAHKLVLDKQGYMHARACTRPRFRARARARARTHTHTHIRINL